MQSNGDSTPYLLSAAVSSGSDNYSYLKVAQMDAGLDYWNLMAYDYAGSWSTFTDNQANLYGPSLSGYGTDAAIAWYVGQGASASKITVGVPMYGRAFENTKGIGSPFTGVSSALSSSSASLDSTHVRGRLALAPLRPVFTRTRICVSVCPSCMVFLSLASFIALQGAVVYENSTDVTSYSYDAAKQEFVSYDTPNIVKMKAQYVVQQGLAGSMFWEVSHRGDGYVPRLV
jgi:chitinase